MHLDHPLVAIICGHHQQRDLAAAVSDLKRKDPVTTPAINEPRQHRRLIACQGRHLDLLGEHQWHFPVFGRRDLYVPRDALVARLAVRIHPLRDAVPVLLRELGETCQQILKLSPLLGTPIAGSSAPTRHLLEVCPDGLFALGVALQLCILQRRPAGHIARRHISARTQQAEHDGGVAVVGGIYERGSAVAILLVDLRATSQ
mmetsp:Transcript_24177/g.79600  ORF Transcript_24177/g.79600 Transcript_24177/m.79600 type:complete len:202 (-) Transcript_24177:298-903(-)